MQTNDKSKSPIIGEMIFSNFTVNVFALFAQGALFFNKALPLATYSADEPTEAIKRQVAFEVLGYCCAITLVTIVVLALLNSSYLDRVGKFGHERSHMLLPTILVPGLIHALICGFLTLRILS